MRGLLVLIALAGIGAAVFFWRQAEDYRTRLEGLTADLTAANEELSDARGQERLIFKLANITF